jgi:hypothetical protein
VQAAAAAAAAVAAAQVEEVQQPIEAPSVSDGAVKPVVAAFVGGKGLKESDMKMLPPGREVRQPHIYGTVLGDVSVSSAGRASPAWLASVATACSSSRLRCSYSLRGIQ